RLTTKETDLCIALSLSGSTPAQILTHLKKLNSDNCSTATTINNCMVKFRLKQLSGRTRMQKLLDDDNQQLQKGLAEVFPEATNLLCAFHIKRNVCANFKTNHGERSTQSGFLMLRWLARKEKFVCAWTNQIKHFGNRTTNRVEGEHAILKRFLKCFTGNFLKGLHEHRRSPYIKHLVYHVSRTALDFILREIKSLSKRDPGGCQHLIRKTHGLPCACEISKCYLMGQTLQLDCIDEHWKKLSLVPVHKKVVGDVDWESIVEKIKSRYKGSTQEQRQ
ncbi:hypothetical protein MKW98_029581, partial [Papaver atlanticum]